VPAHKLKPIKVNLLPKDPFSQTSVGKFLDWSLSVGRYIVVFTEMVVIVTFLSRFTLDRQLTDLNESIIKKQALLESYASLEEKIKIVQQKGAFIDTIDTNQELLDVLAIIVNRLPRDIIYSQLDVRDDKVVIVATAYSQISLERFINDINTDPAFSDVLLDKINTSENETGINFILRANVASYQPPQPKSPDNSTNSTDSDLEP
jgi:hypothetical protein